MAPALTEPLSSNNTLSASTSSASPRPSISNTTSNNSLKSLNHNCVRNGNINNNKSPNSSSESATTPVILNVNHNNNTQRSVGIIENNSNKNNNNNLYRRSLTPTCAFQSAFEESIKKAGIPLPEEKVKKSKKISSKATVVKSILIKSASTEVQQDQQDQQQQQQQQSNSPKKFNNNKTRATTTIIAPSGSKENLSKNFISQKVKTESIHSQQENFINKISPKNKNNNNNSNNLNRIGKSTNGPSSLLSTSSIVCNSIEAKATSATTPTKSNKTNKLMGPMSNTTQKDFSQNIFSQDLVKIAVEEPHQQEEEHSSSQLQQQVKNKNFLQGFIPIDKDFEEAINNTLRINSYKRGNNIRQDHHQQQREKNDEEILLKLQDLQQMEDLSNCNDNINDNNVNISGKQIVLSGNVLDVNDDINIIGNKTNSGVTIHDNCENISDSGCGIDKDIDEDVIIECDSRNQQTDIEFSQQEIRSTGTTDTTVSASEGENNFLEDNFQDSSQTLCHSQENTPIRLINRHSPPKTPISASQHLSQIIIGTPTSSILTPQSSIGLGSSAMGLQKDFKDSEMDDQVLSDMDLLQVLKGLDTTSGGDNLCDLAGNLGLFNDVDVMNYEEIAVPNIKETDSTLDIRNSIEKYHQQMERKCEYLMRRLRKLQSRYMGKHASEEICGLFEWTNRLVRRKDQHEQIPLLTYEEDKHRPVSATAMRTLLRKIDLVSKAQHSNASDPSSQPLKKYKCSSRSTSLINTNLIDKKGSSAAASSTITPNAVSSSTVIKTFDEKTTDEMRHISGLLHSEIRQVQCAFDSDATASSSGGESADEMVTYNNQLQQPLSISKRAGWRWARDRSAIASRWTWLCGQIADLEYKIRQHNELHSQIRKNKGVVLFESSSPLNGKSIKDNQNRERDTSVEMMPTIDFAGDNNNRADIITSSGDNITINSVNNVNGYRGILPNLNNNGGGVISLNSDRQNKSQIDESGGDASTVTEDDDEDLLTACRTRAFQRSGFRKRKLLQTANVHTVSKKAARPSTVKCGCQWPFNPCALCTGRPDPTAPRDLPDTMMPAERIALLDPGYHPVLSFSEDVPTSIHIEAILHMPEWQYKLIRSVSKNSKLLGRKSEDRSASGHAKSSGDPSTKRQYNKSGQKSRKDSSSATASTNKVKKNRKNHDYPSEFSHPSGTVQSPQNSSNSSIKNKHRKTSSCTVMSSSTGQTMLASNNSGLNLSNNTSGFNSSALNSSTTNSINGFQSAFAESLVNNFQCDNLDGSSNGVLPRSKNASPTPGSSGNYKHERSLERRNRNSYDIDNIVIPYSVAASTRVEILPYKEIPTPKWRVIDDDKLNDIDDDLMDQTEDQSYDNKNSETETLAKLNCSTEDEIIPNTLTTNMDTTKLDSTIDLFEDNLNEDDISSTANEFDEDISAEAIQSRHERALLEERKKFSTYLKFPWSTRSRANRRIDSRAESSGTNTPDPTSPAPPTPNVGGDQESIPSPAAPSTPLAAIQGDLNDTDIWNTNSGHRRERKRTVSSKKDRDIFGIPSSFERRSQSPDLREIVPPYEPLQFPIPDDIFDKMLQLMPIINDDIDDNSNMISGISSNNIGNGSDNTENILCNSNSDNNISKKLNGDGNSSSRKNSFSLKLSDTFNDINNMDIFSSSTTSTITTTTNATNNDEFCKINNNNINININSNSLNNNNNNFSSKKVDFSMENNSFHEYFDSNEKSFLLPGDSDTDSAESGLEEDPNDPEWKEPE